MHVCMSVYVYVFMKDDLTSSERDEWEDELETAEIILIRVSMYYACMHACVCVFINCKCTCVALCIPHACIHTYRHT